ncbi:MAG: SPFH domain-containing protein [Eubacterium sp.]|nr:SPFH domain-containing protein [Eubacterium sp.]
MGLIQAAVGALYGTLTDQWKEYFYCESMDSDVLVKRGVKKNGSRFFEDNVIADGSKIAVADGQCMIIVENGKVMDVCAEPGGYIYDTKTSPTVFGGKFVEGLSAIAKETWRRFQFGGGPGKDQRIYYFNTKEIVGNKYGTATPIPFRIVDRNIGMDMDISVRCNGEFSYRIVNPMLFYTNVCGNIAKDYERDQIDSQLKSELLTALQPAFGKLAETGVRYSMLPNHTTEIADALNATLSKKWIELRGLEVVSFGINSISIPKEDEDMIKTAQKKAMMKDSAYATASLKDAAAEAMVAAAKNEGGAMTGFMGMNMAGNMAGNIFGQDAAAQPQQPAQPQAPAGGWTCSCGTVNTGKFCSECGSPKPVEETWTCSCGTVNKGKFCSECGAKKPEGGAKCGNCGWVSDDPSANPKFCPECGTPIQ